LRAHNIECAIYELSGLRDAVPMPRSYGSTPSFEKEPGIIALEDLSDKGIVLPITSFGNGLTPGQLDSILDALASVHAWSVNNTTWRQSIPSLAEFNVFEPMIESTLAMLPKSKEMFPDLFKDLDEKKLNEYINSEKYLEIFGGDPKGRYNFPLALVHGDVHIMNMMFDVKSAKVAGDKIVAVIDWQVAHQGCGLEDVARLLLMSISAEIRRKQGDQIVQRYVELFNSKLDGPQNRVTIQDAMKAMDEMFAYTSIMWSIGIGMVDSFTAGIPFSNEEEKQDFRNRMVESYSDNYKDALKILNW